MKWKSSLDGRVRLGHMGRGRTLNLEDIIKITKALKKGQICCRMSIEEFVTLSDAEVAIKKIMSKNKLEPKEWKGKEE